MNPISVGASTSDNQAGQLEHLDLQAAIALVLGHMSTALGGMSISADDDFLSIGGDSILAVQVVQDVHQSTGIHIPIAFFYAGPTAAELGQVLVELAEQARDAEVGP